MKNYTVSCFCMHLGNEITEENPLSTKMVPHIFGIYICPNCGARISIIPKEEVEEGK